jgi:hypothetical protein
MPECIIREKEYLGDGIWRVDAVYSDDGGTRTGAHRIEAKEKAKDADLVKAVIALYA